LHVELSGAPAGGSLALVIEGPEPRRLQLREADDFTIDRLSPGSWRVVIEAPGGSAAAQAEVSAGATTEVPLALAAWSSLTGTIVDRRTRAPVGGLHAMIERKIATADEVIAQSMQWMSLLQGGGRNRVDADGRFTIDRLPPGPVTVEFISLPSMDLNAELRIADLQPAETRDVGEIRALVLDEVPAAERGWLGLKTKEQGPPGQPTQLVVTDVATGSPAAAADVREGDELERIDDVDVSELGAGVVRMLLSADHVRIGDTRTLVVRRADGTRRAVDLHAVAPKRESKQ
jgi:hypothetical protein